MSIFVDNLKALRRLDASTQADIAQIVGLSRSAVSALENNKNDPSIDTLIKLADYFNVTIDELVRHDLSQRSKHFSTQPV